MCLTIRSTKKFQEEKIDVYKYVHINNNFLYNLNKGISPILSPFTYSVILEGWYEASGPIDIRPAFIGDFKDIKDELRNLKVLYGGVIHCFKQKLAYNDSVLLKCIGYRDDFVAENAWEIAFTKIFVPKEEIDRIIGENGLYRA